MLRNGNQSVEQPDPPKKETKMFWKGIWEKDASHNNKPKWIAELKADHQASVTQQQLVTISEEDLRLRVTRIKNWTAPEPDMIHAYWLKRLTSLHKRLACQMEKLATEGDHPSWLTHDERPTTRFNPQQLPTNHISVHNLEASIWYTGRQDWSLHG